MQIIIIVSYACTQYFLGGKSEARGGGGVVMGFSWLLCDTAATTRLTHIGLFLKKKHFLFKIFPNVLIISWNISILKYV